MMMRNINPKKQLLKHLFDRSLELKSQKMRQKLAIPSEKGAVQNHRSSIRK